MTKISTARAAAAFAFDNTYAQQLPGFYASWKADTVARPEIVKFNDGLGQALGLDAKLLESDEGAAIFAGNIAPDGAALIAQAYAGHQFGGFSPRLGDGRALLLGEIIDAAGRRVDIQLKGSGPTPFSRGGDGKATLGPVLREYLIAEAMHALGIATTRALAAVTTGEGVLRERVLPGAVLTRVAASHIRVGTFEFFAARGEVDNVRKLADYVINRHFPELKTTPTPYLNLLSAVRDRQAALIASWMHVGFIHGVMNTDNMTICGETIDYGPCAFMDQYDPQTVFSSIDRHGRYAYGQQPPIAQWNLARLAETLLPLMGDDLDRNIEAATDAVRAFQESYETFWLDGMRVKLGLSNQEDADLTLAHDFLDMLERNEADYTLAFRHLSSAAQGDDSPIRALFNHPSTYDSWALRYRARLARDGLETRARVEAMRRANPTLIPRNHRVEEALTAAVEGGDYRPFETLHAALSQPYDDREAFKAFAEAPPKSSVPYRTFCGT